MQRKTTCAQIILGCGLLAFAASARSAPKTAYMKCFAALETANEGRSLGPTGPTRTSSAPFAKRLSNGQTVYIVPRAKLGSQFGYYILTDKAAYIDPFSSYELKVQRNSEGRLIAPHRLSGLRVEGQPISMLVSRDSGGSESGPNWPDLWVYDDADLKAEVTEDPVSTSTIAGLAVSQAFHKDPKAGETFHNSSLKDRMKMVKKQIPIEDAQAAIGTGVDASLAAVARDQVASLWSTYARKLEDHEQWKKDPSLDSREPPTPDKKDFEAALGACEEASRTTAEGPAHNELSSELKWQKQLFATNGAAARSGHGADVSPGQGVAPSHRQ